MHRALYTEINAKQLAMARSFDRPITFIAPDEHQDPKRLDDAWDVWKADSTERGGLLDLSFAEIISRPSIFGCGFQHSGSSALALVSRRNGRR